MQNKLILIPGFILMVALQWYFPLHTIMNKENTIQDGTLYKFEANPYIPSDIYQGVDIYLNLKEATVNVENAYDWQSGDHIYVSLSMDSTGFAQVNSLHKEKPTSGDFVSAIVSYSYNDSLQQAVINYPFSTYYLRDSEATEQILKEQGDTTLPAYIVVNVLNGDAVVTDLVVNGRSLK